MGDKLKTINIRLPTELAGKFDRLSERVPGLTKSVLLRLLLSELLNRPLDEQVQIVTDNILKPVDNGQEPIPQNRMTNPNTRRRPR